MNGVGATGGNGSQDRSSKDEMADLAEGLRALSELTMGQMSLTATLTKVAEYAVLAIPGAEGAGLTFISPDGSETMVASTPFVSEVDAVQYGLRQGPCITAAEGAQTVTSHSLGDDDRWPDFGPQVSALGVHSALSLPLIAPDRVVGAMNIYARSPNVFDARAADLGEMFTVPAAIAVQNAHVLAQARMLTAQLQSVLSRRAAIDQAVGLLIGHNGVSADEAFQQLEQTAQTQNVTLDELAAGLLREASRGGVHPESLT